MGRAFDTAWPHDSAPGPPSNRCRPPATERLAHARPPIPAASALHDAYLQFREAGADITRMDDRTPKTIQAMANEVIEAVACENPLSARVYPG